ncbi:MAG: type II toxin-antitoxin system antitoxin SocA domain-containing protein [bacterium]
MIKKISIQQYKSQDDFDQYKQEETIDDELEKEETSSEKTIKWIDVSSNNKLEVEMSFDASVSVLDVASYILKKIGTMTTMKLQKLVYYSQAWSLVWDEVPLFKEPIEAWMSGPVVRELFNYHRGQFQISSVATGNPDILNTTTQKETVEAVVNYYGKYSSQWLSDLTHKEDPWKNARHNILDTQRGNKIISLQSMAEYYGSLPPEE